MGYPKIVYDAGAGPVTLLFTYPPVQKPGSDERQATRSDSITSSGLKQTVFERLDVFRTLQFDFVPFADLADWETFIEWALQGNQFHYYPDRDIADRTDWTLDDQGWTPAYSAKQIAKFKIKLRRVVPLDSGS